MIICISTYIYILLMAALLLHLLKLPARSKSSVPVSEPIGYIRAIDQGSLKEVEYSYDCGCPLDPQHIVYAAEHDATEILKYLYNQGCPCTPDVMVVLVEKGDLETIQWLHCHGAPWDQRATQVAYHSKQDQILQYLIDNVCPIMKSIKSDLSQRH